jgi:hypothetical protein
MTNKRRGASSPSVVPPVLGLASAGGFVGFFGGFWVLPSAWHTTGVLVGVLGGAVAGWRLARRAKLQQGNRGHGAPDDSTDGGL